MICRVWDGKKMRYGDMCGEQIAIKMNGDVIRIWRSKNECFTKSMPDARAMLWTGLIDMAGTRIYEEDIVSVPYVNPLGKVCREPGDRKARIVYENGGFYLTGSGAKESISEWQELGKVEYIPTYSEVYNKLQKTILQIVGNVYENPEVMRNEDR